KEGGGVLAAIITYHLVNEKRLEVLFRHFICLLMFTQKIFNELHLRDHQDLDLLRYSFTREKREIAYIPTLAVNPVYRRMGLGNFLFTLLKALLQLIILYLTNYLSNYITSTSNVIGYSITIYL